MRDVASARPGPLDEPVRASLRGPHAHLAQGHGDAVRYDPDVAPFLAEPRSSAEWDDVAALVGPGGSTVVPAFGALAPEGVELGRVMPGVQLVGDDVAGRPDPGVVRLGPGDVPAMRDLVARTRPGPFEPRTIAMGTYLGVVSGGTLVAMAGERLHTPRRTTPRPSGSTSTSGSGCAPGRTSPRSPSRAPSPASRPGPETGGP